MYEVSRTQAEPMKVKQIFYEKVGDDYEVLPVVKDVGLLWTNIDEEIPVNHWWKKEG